MSVSPNHRRTIADAVEDKGMAPPPGTHNGDNGSAGGGTKDAAVGRERPSRVPPGQPTDEQLLARYRDGDKDAFSQLVERYQRELFHFLVRFLGDRAAAEDVFQESFLQVHQSAGQ